MALSDEDVREILRLIDESEVQELRIETDGLKLHVVRGPEAGDVDEIPVAIRQESHPPDVPEAAQPARDGLSTIDAPMLGTFYRAEAPGAAPFVEVGSEVQPDTVVCIIEVMKMMNSVPAGVSGTIVEICGENGRLVEYGEPLFRVQPA